MLLSDLKVVEWSTWIAGPGCAAVMADWGAQVVKIESATGDASRGFWPDTAECPGNPIFSNENRGKRGVVLEHRKLPRSRRFGLAILRDADVFVTNVRPGALKRARLDYDSLKAELPQLADLRKRHRIRPHRPRRRHPGLRPDRFLEPKWRGRRDQPA